MPIKTHGTMIIISSPSGAGKTTLVKLLSERLNFYISTSHTTRKPRKNEINSKDYFFVQKIEFEKLIKENYFLEYANVFENLYGTSKNQVIENLEKGNDVIFDIDWQGAKQIREKKLSYKLITFFVLPPSKEVLIQRLSNREKEDKIVVKKRMENFESDVLHWKEYDYVVVNDELENCYNQIFQIIEKLRKGEEHKIDEKFLNNHVNKLIS